MRLQVFHLLIIFGCVRSEWNASTYLQVGSDGDGGYTQVVSSHSGNRFWMSFQSYRPDNRSLVIETCNVLGRCLRSVVDEGPEAHDIGKFQKMSLGTNGLPVLCYPARSEMRLASCLDVKCSEISVEVVDRNISALNSRLGGPKKCSIADENHIVYTKFGDLMIAIRYSTGWRRSMIAAGQITYPSLQLVSASIKNNATTFAAISYRDKSEGANVLKVAKCKLPCNWGVSVETWDARGDTGHYSSLVALGEGLVVHYVDKTSGTLLSASDITGTVQLITLDIVGGPGACPGLPSCPYGAFLTSIAYAGDVWVSYFDESEGASSVGRVKVRNGASGIIWTDAGPDGWGRDTCLAMMPDRKLVVTYMKYAKDSTKKKARLAVLLNQSLTFV